MTIATRAFLVGVIALLTYCGLVIVPCFRAHAQTGQILEEVWKNAAKLGDLGERVQRNEGAADALQGRVNKVEVDIAGLRNAVETSNKLMFGCLGGTLLILIDRGISLIGKRRRIEPPE